MTPSYICFTSACATQCELQSVSARPGLIASKCDSFPRCPQATASSTELSLLLVAQRSQSAGVGQPIYDAWPLRMPCLTELF
ncbi:hypothetical protein M441DRAFT_321961 [Trichoderma asperellum CBS 433.97]|uniref:Uncharacterized protein n=1 Tax=Trichoderma asperellum (strain ATCC 204424 / CBS 433.97 / NBRC 101777) TaxID=1042311 RepID=A0A2T3ZLG1_TRIA4|nr:hypothetical protein M441DRAFT_321961 [Trichoderma asperellum CBS 433.97]PTB45644.1 hypothetical protein M441DRAFT_321961 [Trichoderma asperellum CBS 433.97]